MLDNFALLSGQLNTINKLLRNEKTPSYRSQVIIPLLLSPDRDEELAVSNEHIYNVTLVMMRDDTITGKNGLFNFKVKPSLYCYFPETNRAASACVQP